MCGIAGSRDRDDALALADRLRHRGPDGRTWVEVRFPDGAAFTLALQRLAVTSPGAPAGPYADGPVVAAVNGEIWNHEALRTELTARGFPPPPGADTAVVPTLLRADGPAGLARLRGMFAIVAADARTGDVVVARDAAGIKPLHGTAVGAPLRVASEAGALAGGAAPGADLDRAALADYLALGCVTGERSIRSTVRSFPAGRALVLRAADGAVVRAVPLREPDPWRSEPGRADARVFSPDVDGRPGRATLRETLVAAVRRHLPQDVPGGILLSGGLDSATVAVLAAAAARDADPGGASVRTYSVGFPGEGAFDESGAARRVARHVARIAPRSVHTEVALTPADVPGLLARLVAGGADPFADASALAAFAVCRRAAEDVRVLLSGTGADELFAGYRRYGALRWPRAVLAVAGAAGAILPTTRRTRRGTLGAWARKAGRAALRDPAERYLGALAVVPDAWRRRLLPDAEPPVLGTFRAVFGAGAERGGGAGPVPFADAARAADALVYLPADLLVKEDRAAMAASIENRVPFLDDELTALAAGAPASAHTAARSGRDADGRPWRVRGPKASLRAAVAHLLPEEIRDRPKQGFGVPVSEWLRGPCAGLVRDLLGPRDARCRLVLDGATADRLVAAHRAGDDDLGAAVWALVVLEASLRGGDLS